MEEIKTKLLEVIKEDLADNYNEDDEEVLIELLDDVIVDALSMSNRTETENNIKLLQSNIKKATKSIYKQRGTEEVKSDSQSGKSSTYDDVMDTMLKDIIKQRKRLLR